MEAVIEAIQSGNIQLLIWVVLIVVFSAIIQFFANYYLGERLKADIKSSTDQRLERFRSELRVIGRARDKKQDVLIEMIDIIGEAQVAITQLIRANQQGPGTLNAAWQTAYARMSQLADFNAKYCSPYMDKYKTKVDDVFKCFDEITHELERAKAAGEIKYNISFDHFLMISNELKETMYSDCIELADHSNGA
ncbi:hypothetical protein KAW18_15990 [candidate division WOR-3 bacterium]|nr:hypothetical protein [candidate division WOR-3 bacterium]